MSRSWSSVLRRATGIGWIAYAMVSLIHLGTQIVVDRRLIDLTIAWPMPVLALVLLLGSPRRRDRMTVLVLVAVAWCWAGDTLGAIDLLIKLGCFLVAQLCLVVAFWPATRRGAPTRWPVRAAYAVGTLVLIVMLAPAAGGLAPVVVGYGVALGAMAWAAAGLGRRGSAGGLLFVLSDALLAGQLFSGWAHPLLGTVIMATYLSAMGLLVSAVLAGRRTG